MESRSYEEQAVSLGKRLCSEREISEISIERAAAQLGVSSETIESMEKGETIPSLPELELLASLYRVSLSSLTDESEKVDQPARIKPEKRPAFLLLRTRMVSAIVKQARLDSGTPPEEVGKTLDIPLEILEEYESGATPIPYPVLVALCSVLNIDPASLLSPLTEKTEKSTSADLPEGMDAALRDFISSPANLPYLQLARRLSETDAAKLRQIAENILEITY